MNIRGQQDFTAGLLFATIGGLGVFLTRALPAGSATQMGPGYLPGILSWAILCGGIFIIGMGLARTGSVLTSFKFRPLLLTLAAVGLFALLIESAGLIAAAVVSVVTTSFATPEIRVRESLVWAAGLAIGAALLFNKGLGLSLPLLPPT